MKTMPLLGLIALGTLLIPSGSATHNNPDPVAWWKLDETVAGPVEDSAGTNDGTNNGATINQPGHFGGAYSFDGTDDLVSVPDAAVLDFAGNRMTLSLWAKADSFPNTFPKIVDKLQGASDGYLLNVRQAENVYGFQVGSVVAKSTSAPSTSVYQNVVGTYDGANVQIYVDGVLEGTMAYTGPINTGDNTRDLRLGNGPVAGREWDGSIDDVRLYDSALEAWQVEDLFLDPEHHQCVASYGVQGVGDLIEEMSPTLILVFAILAIIGGLIAWGAKKGSLFALLGTVFLAAFSGILSSPTVTATHECVLTSFSGANTTLHFLVVLAFILVFIAVVVGGFMAHNQRKKA